MHLLFASIDVIRLLPLRDTSRFMFATNLTSHTTNIPTTVDPWTDKWAGIVLTSAVIPHPRRMAAWTSPVIILRDDRSRGQKLFVRLHRSDKPPSRGERKYFTNEGL